MLLFLSCAPLSVLFIMVILLCTVQSDDGLLKRSMFSVKITGLY